MHGRSGRTTGDSRPRRDLHNDDHVVGQPHKSWIQRARPAPCPGQRFEKAYPGITVKIETAPSDTDTNRADLVTTISGGASEPDVFMGDVIWPGQFGAHQLALPLSKYLPASFWARFAPGLVAGASYDGQVYGAPFFQDQGFLYYRSDLLKAAGMSVPKTWQQLSSDAATLVKQGKVKYGFVFEGNSYEGGTCDFMEYYADTGGQVLNSTDSASELNVADATQVLSFVRGLVTSGASPSAVDTFEETQANDAFDNGQAAFLRNWDYAWSTAQSTGSKVIGKTGVAPLPTFAGHPYPGYSNIGGWNLYINPHSKNITADLNFIKFITGTVAQTINRRHRGRRSRPTQPSGPTRPPSPRTRRSRSCPRPSSSRGRLRTRTTRRYPKPYIRTSTRLSPASSSPAAAAARHGQPAQDSRLVQRPIEHGLANADGPTTGRLGAVSSATILERSQLGIPALAPGSPSDAPPQLAPARRVRPDQIRRRFARLGWAFSAPALLCSPPLRSFPMLFSVPLCFPKSMLPPVASACGAHRFQLRQGGDVGAVAPRTVVHDHLPS